MITIKTIINKKGQALVEFTIILPLLLLLVMGIFEFGMMLNAYLAIQNESREGARAGALGGTNAEIESLIVSTAPQLNSSDLIITVTPADGSRKTGDTITVSVVYEYHLTVPIVSSLFNNIVSLNAQTSMRVE